MTRREQVNARRAARGLCEATYDGEDPSFLNARCKRETEHSDLHATWRRKDSTGHLISVVWS